MKWFTIIWILFLCVLLFFAFFARKYRNPYKLIMIFGKKGSGKSTLLTRLAIKEAKSGKTVYSNMPINYPGIRLYDPMDIGNRSFPEESVVFCDEVGMIWDAREYRSFRPEVRDWFKLQRKHRVKVYLFSQTFDIDVKLRNLTDLMFMCTCHFNCLSVARRVNRKLVVVEPTGDSEGRITDGYEIQNLFWQIFGLRSIYLTWIPAYKKYFDTRYMDQKQDVPDIDFEEVTVEEPYSKTWPSKLIDSMKAPFMRFHALNRSLRSLQAKPEDLSEIEDFDLFEDNAEPPFTNSP